MKILIEIPERVFEHAKETSEDSIDETTAMRAIANGTPITDDVICDYKKYIKVLERIKGDRLAHVIANQIRIEIEKLEGGAKNGD